MIKIALLLLLIIGGWRWAFGQWPWAYLQDPTKGLPGTQKAKQLNRARLLLGVSQSASASEIRDAHIKLATELHPDKGGSSARLAEINAARDLLLADAGEDTRE
jgi:hypothetical protein